MPKGRALTIGLNFVNEERYEGWQAVLHGCENDARRMAEIATAQKFSKVKTLLSSQATLAVVTSELKDAAKDMKAGDLFLLTFSGHGGQCPDFSGMEPDETNETWCLYDGQLVDDRINDLLSAFDAGVRILVVSDSCHSGSVTQVPPLKVRFLESESLASIRLDFPETTHQPRVKSMPPRVAARIARAGRISAEGSTGEPRALVDAKASILLLSACPDKEETTDGFPDCRFTTNLLLAWNSGAFHGTHWEFRAAIERLVGKPVPQLFPTGDVTTGFDGQTPFTI